MPLRRRGLLVLSGPVSVHVVPPVVPEDSAQVSQQRHPLAVVHLPVRHPAKQEGDSRGQQQHEVIADVAVGDVSDMQAGPP